jgi:hypothetical protein
MKTRLVALVTAENESGRAKRDPAHSVSLKTILSSQIMKTAPDALGTAENESGRAKDENRS